MTRGYLCPGVNRPAVPIRETDPIPQGEGQFSQCSACDAYLHTLPGGVMPPHHPRYVPD